MVSSDSPLIGADVRQAWDASNKIMLARDAKNACGLMIDTARLEPVLIEKHECGVVIVGAMEEYERLTVGPVVVAKTGGKASGASRK